MNKTIATTCAFVFTASFAYADILHIQNGQNVPVSVGYGTDAGTVPVQVIGTVSTTGGGGATTVTPGTGTWTVTAGSGPWTVTEGTGPFVVIIATPPVAVPIVSTGNITVNITTPSVAVPIISTSNITVNITTPSVAMPIVSTSNITVNITTPSVAVPIVSTTTLNVSTHAVVNPSGGSLVVVPSSSGTWTVTAGTGSFQSVNSTVAVVNSGGQSLTTVPSSSGTYTVVPATGVFTVTPASSGTYTVTPGTGTFNVNKATVSVQVVVTSTTFQVPPSQGSTTTLTSDGISRLLIAAVPWTLMLTTASVNVSTQSATEIIIIASAAVTNYNYLCDCLFANTSSSVQSVSLYQSTLGSTANDFFTVSVSSFAPTFYGSGLGCADPILRSKQGGQITLKPSATVTSTTMRCRYYAAP